MTTLAAPILIFLLVNVGYATEQEVLAPQECPIGETCIVDIPEMICADGTQSYLTVTRRKENNSALLIHFQGGGACWSRFSCNNGFARNLTRKEPTSDWMSGPGIMDSKAEWNVTRDFDVIDVFYCSGDVYAGDKTVEYSRSMTIEHRGYSNAIKALDYAQQHYPTPEKAMLFGCSAGGIGALYHLENFVERFPNAERTVISDAGLPLMHPEVPKDNFNKVLATWGAKDNLPDPLKEQVDPHLGHIVQYNRETYGDTYFGFISSTHDRTMAGFSAALGAWRPYRAVKNMVERVSETYIGAESPNAKVYYLSGKRHCHGYLDWSQTSAKEGANLADWVTSAVKRDKGFKNIRGDLDLPAPDLPPIEIPRENLSAGR